MEPGRHSSKFFLGGGVAMLALWPYTMFALMPINNQGSILQNSFPAENSWTNFHPHILDKLPQKTNKFI
jgi:hypothetical protein